MRQSKFTENAAVEEHPAVIESKVALDEAIATCVRCDADKFPMKRSLNTLHDATMRRLKGTRSGHRCFLAQQIVCTSAEPR